MAAQQDPEEPEFELPRRFGRYVLFDRIGRGGMAEIYLARGTTQMGAARLAVVKLVLNRFANDPAFGSMLISEARLAARLSNANVVQTFDLGREEGRLYIAMEYVEGFDLTQLLKKLRERKLAMPAEFGFFVVMEMLRGLDYAHRCTDDSGAQLGIVHRDVSPSNVLVSLEGEVKLCDFGIARAVSDLSELPEGALEGKAAYMSPEHARGEKVDARADVFSATTILWEILSGRRMYKAQEGRDVLAVAKSGDVPPLPDRGLPDYPRLSSIVAKGLARDRSDRYPSAGALLDDLEDYVVKNRITASPMRFGAWLTDHFEEDIVAVRRERERHAIGLASELPMPEVIPTLASRDSAPALDVQPVASTEKPSHKRAATVDELDAEAEDIADLDAIERESHFKPSEPPQTPPSDQPPMLSAGAALSHVQLATTPEASKTTPDEKPATTAVTSPSEPARKPSPAVLAAAVVGALVLVLVLVFALKG